MKRTPLILTLGSLLLLAGAIGLYRAYFKKDSTSVWSIIPDQAVLVYEVGECEECVKKISETVIGNLIHSIADFQLRDSLKGSLDFLSSLKKGAIVSMHIVNKEDFDFIYYSSPSQNTNYNALHTSLGSIKGVQLTTRVLNGVKIQEFDLGKRKFSCAKLGEIWVGSFTSFLIEDVIRTNTSEAKSNFKNDIREVYLLPKVKNDLGNVYVHLGNFTRWLSVFSETPFFALPKFGQASLLDVENSDNSITLNGFSLSAKDSSESVLSYFKNQSPVQFTLKQYFSNRTVFAINYGISDGSIFYRDVLLKRNKANQDSLAALIKFDFTKLYSSFGNELALCYQEEKGRFSNVILFETNKPNEWIQVFDRLSIVAEMEDTIFYEKYSTYEIREIEIRNLPGKLFGPLASDFKQTYYTSIGNTVILSEQLEQIKLFIDDIDQEEVWGKSVAVNKFLETTLLESNISLYVNTPLVWSTLAKKLNPHWKTFVQKNHLLLSNLGFGAIQFSNLNESFYTNLTLNYSPTQVKGNIGEVKSDRMITNFTSSLMGKPFIVRTHLSRNDEVLLQDSVHTLYYIGGDGKVVWSRDLEEPIISNVGQVDFFKNGKLQFFFATKNKLHLIDRLGNYVNPFPKEIRAGEIQFVSILDYDNSKNYRFLLADKLGKVWMYDKDIQTLDGWKPKNLAGELFTGASHHRIRGKDYMVAIRKDGWAYILSRKGENVKGFPLNLDARPDGDYFIETGNGLGTTYFVIISKEGFRIKFNLEGKILSRETLVKPSFSTQFKLIAEKHRKSYVILRQDSKQLSILNEDGTEILVNSFVGINPVDVKYYDFGAGKTYISVTDLTQDLSFIYNEKGMLLTSTPLEGESIELRPGMTDMPKLFIVNGRALILQE